MININELTTDHKIKLKKPMGCFDNLGEVCEIVKIDTDENVINFRFGADGVHLGVMSGDELEKYFDVIEPIIVPDDYDWHPYGFIEDNPVEYRADVNGGIHMSIGYNGSIIAVSYNHPEIGYRKIQNGQQGKFYENDLKVAFFKLQKSYYDQLYKDVHYEVESEYFAKRDECGLEFNEW